MLANSMSDIAIRVENLGKQYKIGRLQKRHDTLRDALADSRLQIANGVSQLANRFSHIGNGKSGMANRASSTANHGKRPADGAMPSAISDSPSADVIWALRDVSFEVKRGEVVGIIGRNGAGKSTLLKILSRITEPTTGAVDLYGRVASLLEVGTGFHPELTGRENIFLNGAILGMRKAEIEKKFDEIVAFAEVEKFIDTPVKRYSSGMYVRLAFAVAAHLEPEILLVDEVLAVGDAAFQKKCLGKMGDVAREGRTVLFVSHNTVAMKLLCTRALWFNEGQILQDADAHNVVGNYLASLGEPSKRDGDLSKAFRRYSTGEARFQLVSVANHLGATTTSLYLGDPFRINFCLQVKQEIPEAVIEVNIVDTDGMEIASARTLDGENLAIALPVGTHEITLDSNLFLLPRKYLIELIVYHLQGQQIDWVEHAAEFEVMNHAREGVDNYRYWPIMRGYVRTPAKWHLPQGLRSARQTPRPEL